MATNSAYYPPDPHGAAGPSGIIQSVNLRITYWNKSGTALWGPVNLSSFYTGNGGSGNSDPRVVYDVGSSRFYVVMQENTSTQCFLNLAVSKSSNPGGSTTSDWYFYRLDVTETVGTTKYGCDYPGLGVDAQGVYVTYNMYTLPIGSSSTFKNCQIVILKKADINSGTGTYNRVYTPDGASNAFTLQPGTTLGCVGPGNIAYFGETSLYSSTTIRLWAVSDPIGTPVLSSAASITIPDNGGYISGAPQSGTSITIPTVGMRTQGNAFWSDSTLWFCHTAGGSAGRSIIYYYRIKTNNYPTGTPSLLESGGLDGGTGVWNLQPSIGGNAKGDVCIIFTQSSSSIFPTIMFFGRPVGATCWEPPQTLKVSSNYSNSSRWGDFATVTADPTDNTFWISHEWSRSSGSNDWGTYWGNIKANPPTADMTLQNLSECATKTYTASNSITAGPAYLVLNSANVTFHVSNAVSTGIDLKPGFSATAVGASGQTFRAYIGAGGAASPLIAFRSVRPQEGDAKSSNKVSSEKEALPSHFSLSANYPNPFNPTTHINYALPSDVHVSLKVYNALGQVVTTLVDRYENAGYKSAEFDGALVPTGIYFYRIRAGHFAAVGKMLLAK